LSAAGESRPLRLVLDTNVVVAGLLWNGPPRQLMGFANTAMPRLFTSPVLLQELARVLAYPKFANRIESSGFTVENLLKIYMTIVSVVIPDSVPRAVQRDADDDQVIAAAIAAQADMIVTGDDDLLSLRNYHGIPIVTAREAIERLKVV
jgi:uncharacterized protein